MRTTILYGPFDLRVEEVPDPVIHRPTDAIVKVVASCVCGSDLWHYRGLRGQQPPKHIGHEFIGIVHEVGSAVTDIKVGQFVIAPFFACDNTCVHCLNGIQTSCVNIAWWGSPDSEGIPTEGGQSEYMRVPQASGTLVPVGEPGFLPDDTLIPSLTALTDVCATGFHAAYSAKVRPGATVAVVGDGAVGLSAVLAAHRLGANRIIAMSRHDDRADLARTFGATDIVASRGDEGASEVRDLLDGIGADCVLECVGTKESMNQAFASTRPGGHIGFVGVPAGGPELSINTMFSTNISVGGGMAPVRQYIPDLLTDVLEGTINPGLVFTDTFTLTDIASAYTAMDQRQTIKALVLP